MNSVGHSGVKVYAVNGASAGTGTATSLPDWLTRKRAVKGKGKRYIREEFEGSINLIQHFEFPEASNCIRVTKDGHHAIATGVYKPQMRVFDLNQLTLKFERHSDAENVDFMILSDDWTKTIHLQSDRTVELHTQSGLHYRTRIPRFGRALAYHFPSCDALLAGAGNEVYRLNLSQGRFLAPLVLGSDTDDSRVEGVNAVDINPAHNLWSFATEGPGTVEFWDPRSRTSVGCLKLPTSLAARTVNTLPGVTDAQPVLAATALSSRSDGLSLAVGTSTGHTLLYDIRSPIPYATKDQGYDLPIKRVHWIEGGSRMAGDNLVVSADKKVLKIWDRDSPSTNFASITPPTDINDVCHVPGSGLLMLANEGIHMTSYYVPQLGPAPKWCSFLDNLTEEMEGQSVRNVYEDFKFVERAELTRLGLDHLVGTPALKPYMHGYFLSLKLYDTARIIANPFVFAEHREKLVREKLESLSQSRIRSRKDALPKVNRALAERILKNAEKERKAKRKRSGVEEPEQEPDAKESAMVLQDSRFKAVFEDPDFEIDEESREYALLHPSRAGVSSGPASNKRPAKTAVEVEAEEDDAGTSSDDLGMGGSSSSEEDKPDDKEEDSSDEDEHMETVNLRGGPASRSQRPVKPATRQLNMVAAHADLGSGFKSREEHQSMSLGERRKRLPTQKSKTDNDIVQRTADGGYSMSWVPSASSRDEDAEQPRKNKGPARKPGIEYLGAGLEKGVERQEVQESERKGRTQRRRGGRSGSKNTFRKL